MERNITMVNPSETPYSYALFLTLSNSRFCKSVVWQAGELQAQGSTPINWDDDQTEINLGTIKKETIEIKSNWPATCGNSYTLTTVKDKINAQTGPGDKRNPEAIIVSNKTGKKLDIGVSPDKNAALFMESILSNEKVLFEMPPQYHLCILEGTAKIEKGTIVKDPRCESSSVPIEGTLAMTDIKLDNDHSMAMITLSVNTKGLSLIVSYPGSI
ncbi:hypothetical protein [Pseudodesulfovibrio sp.]|uniref:hypothetical protein n=1 Tax=unclassified Pseudodesulfovibrio TaxID=2661612 RepID=UPI003AFFCC9C